MRDWEDCSRLHAAYSSLPVYIRLRGLMLCGCSYFHYMLAAVAEQALHADGEGDASVTDKDPVLVARYQALQVSRGE